MTAKHCYGQTLADAICGRKSGWRLWRWVRGHPRLSTSVQVQGSTSHTRQYLRNIVNISPSPTSEEAVTLSGELSRLVYQERAVIFSISRLSSNMAPIKESALDVTNDWKSSGCTLVHYPVPSRAESVKTWKPMEAFERFGERVSTPNPITQLSNHVACIITVMFCLAARLSTDRHDSCRKQCGSEP